LQHQGIPRRGLTDNALDAPLMAVTNEFVEQEIAKPPTFEIGADHHGKFGLDSVGCPTMTAWQIQAMPFAFISILRN
jgi:hypothetical protein